MVKLYYGLYTLSKISTTEPIWIWWLALEAMQFAHPQAMIILAMQWADGKKKKQKKRHFYMWAVSAAHSPKAQYKYGDAYNNFEALSPFVTAPGIVREFKLSLFWSEIFLK